MWAAIPAAFAATNERETKSSENPGSVATTMNNAQQLFGDPSGDNSFFCMIKSS